MSVAVENVPDIVLWAPAVSAALLLVAALAAWRTAAITGKAFRRSILPELDVSFLSPKAGPLQLAVRNLGGGDAKTSAIILVVRDAAMFEYLGQGFLRSGAGVKFTTQIPAQDLEQGDYFAVAGCRDVNNVFHAWSAHWEHREFRDFWRRPVKTVDWVDVFQAFYPQIDPLGKKPIRYAVEPLAG